MSLNPIFSAAVAAARSAEQQRRTEEEARKAAAAAERQAAAVRNFTELFFAKVLRHAESKRWAATAIEAAGFYAQALASRASDDETQFPSISPEMRMLLHGTFVYGRVTHGNKIPLGYFVGDNADWFPGEMERVTARLKEQKSTTPKRIEHRTSTGDTPLKESDAAPATDNNGLRQVIGDVVDLEGARQRPATTPRSSSDKRPGAGARRQATKQEAATAAS